MSPSQVWWCWFGVADQSLVFHLVYLQRLLCRPSSNDFFLLLVYTFQIYTGHKPVLPWFSCPGLYKAHVSYVTVLKHLGKFLLRLPKLVPSFGWSARCFLDLPLCSVLSTVPSVCPPLIHHLSNLIFLVSGISFWQPDLGIVDAVTPHFAWLSHVLRPDFLAVNRDRGPVSLVFLPAVDSKIVLSQANYFIMSRSDGAASWRPDCTHWAASNSSRSAVSVARLSLGALRRFWHPEKGTTTSRMGPPLKLPAHLLAIDEDVLISLGAVYSTPWKYPWRCVIDESPV